MKRDNLEGMKFTNWSVLEYLGDKQYKCVCDCGAVKNVYSHILKSGKSKSCGCLPSDERIKKLREKIVKHDMYKTKEYKTWDRIKQRCNNKNNSRYKDYGGRGIYVCKEWSESFDQFFKDIGYAPSKDHSIERINNDGPYSKENCKWATKQEQAINRRYNSNEIGEKYVRIEKSSGRYVVEKSTLGKRDFFARFNDLESAVKYRDEKLKELFND